jgi:hypothetical protein
MYRFGLAYRHGSGEVEGVSASALTSDGARAAAIARAREKAGWTPHPFDERRLIFSLTGLTADERATVKSDWEIDCRAGS